MKCDGILVSAKAALYFVSEKINIINCDHCNLALHFLDVTGKSFIALLVMSSYLMEIKVRLLRIQYFTIIKVN